jgi:dihydroorotase
MLAHTRLLLTAGELVTKSGTRPGEVLIEDGRIAAVSPAGQNELGLPPEVPRFDCRGLLVLPAPIDPQVHFREPGNEHKEDLSSGSLAAIAGGVCAYMEMPNTKPSTVTRWALEDKLARAAGRSYADYAFFVGATTENAEILGDLEALPGCAGVKVFMGSSTGDLLVPDDPHLEAVLKNGRRRVTVHAEDEELLQANYKQLPAGSHPERHPEVRSVESAVRATTRLLNLAEKTGRPVHVLHVSTGAEVDLILERKLGDLVTFELTPNHLFLVAPECYQLYGSHAQMNPPVRGREHQQRLRRALSRGELDCIGSDHAPHTAEEKARPYPQSPGGIPGVQTTLPLLLTAVRDGWLTLPGILSATRQGPIRVYNLLDKDPWKLGADADFALIDPHVTTPLPDAWLYSRSRTNPFVGRPLAGYPRHLLLRGEFVLQDKKPIGRPRGQPLRFA